MVGRRVVLLCTKRPFGTPRDSFLFLATDKPFLRNENSFCTTAINNRLVEKTKEENDYLTTPSIASAMACKSSGVSSLLIASGLISARYEPSSSGS